MATAKGRKPGWKLCGIYGLACQQKRFFSHLQVAVCQCFFDKRRSPFGVEASKRPKRMRANERLNVVFDSLCESGDGGSAADIMGDHGSIAKQASALRARKRRALETPPEFFIGSNREQVNEVKARADASLRVKFSPRSLF